MTDKTVSACCKQRMIVNSADEGTCFWICSDCGKACDPNTETVSASKVKMHKDYNIGVVTPDDSPTEPISLCQSCYCMTKTIEAKCGKCKADKPTVEKWERDFDRKFPWYTDGDDVKRFVIKEQYNEVKDFIRTTIAHSLQEAKDVASKEKFEMLRASLKVKNEAVQEAKAERDRKIDILNKYATRNWEIRFHGKYVDINYPDSPVTPDYEDCLSLDEALEEVIHDLPASLKQEEEVLVGIDMEKASADLDKEIAKSKQGGTK